MMMKALVYEGPRQLNLRDVPEPEPGPEEVLIRVAYSGICGSELGGYLGLNSLRKPPLVMGHEFSGEILQLGSQARQHNPELVEGQRVTVNPLWSCGRCRYCLGGRHQLCTRRQILGAHQPGSYAERVKAHARMVYPIPDSLSFEHAALTEPVGCAIRAAELADCKPTDRVLITGLGPIGLLTLQAVLAFGVTDIIVTDTDPDRRAIGEQFGVRVLDPLSTDVMNYIQSSSEGQGVDVAIDAVGANITRRQCVEAVARGGRVIFVGLHEEESPIPINLVIRSEINLQGSFAYTPANFITALQWLAADRIKIDPWLLKAPLAEGRDCFERLLDKSGPVAKILLHI
jgi:2-desacetyl-2-hydroxyethyl bacteriochlorophyllide A dehydrogenase